MNEKISMSKILNKNYLLLAINVELFGVLKDYLLML